MRLSTAVFVRRWGADQIWAQSSPAAAKYASTRRLDVSVLHTNWPSTQWDVTRCPWKKPWEFSKTIRDRCPTTGPELQALTLTHSLFCGAQAATAVTCLQLYTCTPPRYEGICELVTACNTLPACQKPL